MRVGLPREVVDGERRVAIVPDAVRVLRDERQTALVERDAGTAVGFPDGAHRAAGATIVGTDAADLGLASRAAPWRS